ncbi:MAG: hypothetical protein PHI98_16495 [Eubacteriales bacterium]|nr:hypothetical protein [Eubacteriales bacterium]
MSGGDMFGMMFAIPIVCTIVYALKKSGFLRAASILLLVLCFPFTLVIFFTEFPVSSIVQAVIISVLCITGIIFGGEPE